MKSASATGKSDNTPLIKKAYDIIMLVDDNPMDNFINKRLIESCGLASEVICFESAQDALLYLGTNQKLPSLIFLDINMPGMNGFEFLEAYENLPSVIHEKCKVLMLSTSENFKDLNRANKNRFVRKFLNKPLSANVLKAIKV
jgi:CheY-like chemotaxis protein